MAATAERFVGKGQGPKVRVIFPDSSGKLPNGEPAVENVVPKNEQTWAEMAAGLVSQARERSGLFTTKAEGSDGAAQPPKKDEKPVVRNLPEGAQVPSSGDGGGNHNSGGGNGGSGGDGNGNGGQPPSDSHPQGPRKIEPTFTKENTVEFSKGSDNTDGIVAKNLVYVSLAGVGILLLAVFLLCMFKANKGDLQALDEKVTASQAKITQTGEKVDLLDEILGSLDKRVVKVEGDVTGANAKADQAIGVAQKADQKATKALKEMNAFKIRQARAEKAAQKAKVVKPGTKTPSVPTPTAPSVSSAPAGAILLWHAHDATASNPKPCVISAGEGLGLPSYCSTFKVVAAKNGETKNDWLVRVGGGVNPTDTGLYQKQ